MKQRYVLPVALLAAVMITGCASPANTGAPAVSLQVPPRPEQAPAPVSVPAPARLKPELAVTTSKKGGRLFSGPGSFYLLVAELDPETKLDYLDSRQGWLQVQTAEGIRGWLAANEATLADGRNLEGRYVIKPGHWEMAAPAGLKVEVTRRATGVIRVAVSREGSAEGLGEPVAVSDRAIALITPAAGSFSGAIAVGDTGLEQVSVSDRGVLIELERPAAHQVVERAPGRVELEFRPALEQVTEIPDGWRFVVRGEGRPVVRAEKESLLVEIPAAVGHPAIPARLALEEVGPQARMPAGALRLRVPLPQGPYALSQPEPGRYELRRLAPGLAGKRIVVDPGHGGEETGAIGDSGVPEKAVNLAVALRLKPLLEAAGAEVVMTRTEDRWVIDPEMAARQTSFEEEVQADLHQRSVLANSVKADMVISIHANAGPPDDAGIEVFWASSNLNAAQSRHLAELAQAELLSALGLVDRGAKQRAFNVIRYSEAPAVLVEMGFLTNPAEEEILLSDWGQQRIADALLRAVRGYFGG